MTTKQAIVKFLKGNGWQFGGTLEYIIGRAQKTKPSTVSRRCRELCESETIKNRYVEVNGKMVVQYKK